MSVSGRRCGDDSPAVSGWCKKRDTSLLTWRDQGLAQVTRESSLGRLVVQRANRSSEVAKVGSYCASLYCNLHGDGPNSDKNAGLAGLMCF